MLTHKRVGTQSVYFRHAVDISLYALGFDSKRRSTSCLHAVVHPRPCGFDPLACLAIWKPKLIALLSAVFCRWNKCLCFWLEFTCNVIYTTKTIRFRVATRKPTIIYKVFKPFSLTFGLKPTRFTVYL